MDRILSKSEFLDFRECPKSFWLERYRSDEFPPISPSEFERLLLEDGYAVEEQAKRLIATWTDAGRCKFQVVFASNDGLYARADLVRACDDGSIDIFEVKASTSLKSSSGADHVLDACFQVIAAERSGAVVGSANVIHVNRDYRRSGEVDPTALLTIVDVTEEVSERREAIEEEIDSALSFLARTEIDEVGCECRFKGNYNNRCAAFAYLNPDIPALSAHLLPRISRSRLQKLDEEERLAISAITADDLTPSQLPVWKALSTGEAIVDHDAVVAFLSRLEWPLHFSVHRLTAGGKLAHGEYLSPDRGDHEQLVARLQNEVSETGSALSWNMSFEKSCNDRLAELLPDSAEFLENLNLRTVDLMEPFKKDFVHPKFEGSTSIKKVLPVLVPELRYSENAVHDGTGAIRAWSEMVDTDDDQVRVELRDELLAYCKLDTLAMVEIYRYLQHLVRGS